MHKPPPSESIRARVIVSGKVQGVAYRYTTFQEANQLGVGGWVRNLPDGRVEAIFEGSKEAVEAIVRWCHRGPRAAVVKEVAVEYQEPEGMSEFHIRQ